MKYGFLILLFLLLPVAFANGQTPQLNKVLTSIENDVLTVKIESAHNIAGYQFEITYNPAYVSVNEIVYGDFLSEDKSVQTFQVDPNIEEPGIIKAIAEARIGEDEGAMGSGELFKARFNRISPGDAEIWVSDSKVVDPNGLELAHVVTQEKYQASFDSNLIMGAIIVVVFLIVIVMVLKRK